MKTVLFIFFCAIQSIAFSHDFFFAFAELEYNDESQRFEASITASSHDLERVFEAKSWDIDELHGLNAEKSDYSAISNWFFKQFSVLSDAKSVEFTIIGCDVELNGMVHFYVESSPVITPETIEIQFDLLMNDFPEQQNKLTFHYNDQLISKSFLSTTIRHEIRLEHI